MEQVLASGLVQGAAYSLIAVGLVLCFSVSGTINLAQGEFVVLGVLLTGTLAADLGLFLAIVVTIAVVAAMGALLEGLFLRRVADSAPITGIVVTLGIAFFLAGAMRLLWGTDERTLEALTGGGPVDILGATVPPQAFWLWGILAVAVIGLAVGLRQTGPGRALVACAQDRLGAQLCGLRVGSVRASTFALAAGLAAVAGILFGPLTFVGYESGLALMLRGLVAAALGGMRSVTAAVAGGLFLGLCESFAVTYVSSQLKTPIAFAVLLTILAVRPNGFAMAGARS